MVSLSNHAQQFCHRQISTLEASNLKIIVAVYPRSPNLGYPIPVLSMGSCFRSRSKVGKDGVSAGGQRTQALADLFVFGGQSAPKADIASIVDANANRADTAPTATMGPDSRRSSTRPAEQAEAGRQGENVSGRSSDRIPYLQRRASTTARLPTMQTMARRKSGRGKGETYRSVDKVSCLHGKSFISNLCNALTGCQSEKDRLRGSRRNPANPRNLIRFVPAEGLDAAIKPAHQSF